MASRIVFCPKCKKPVEAKDYFSMGGVSDWRVEGAGTMIRCPKCDYSGPPVEATLEEYKKIRKRR